MRARHDMTAMPRVSMLDPHRTGVRVAEDHRLDPQGELEGCPRWTGSSSSRARPSIGSGCRSCCPRSPDEGDVSLFVRPRAAQGPRGHFRRRVATSRSESVSVVIRVITGFFSNFLTELQAERAGQ